MRNLRTDPTLLVFTVTLLLPLGALHAEDVDVIWTKDGSLLRGRVVKMTDGTLELETTFGKKVGIQWSEVARMTTTKTLPFVLSDGTRLNGTAEPGAPGELSIRLEAIEKPTVVPLDRVKAINPPEEKPITFKGALGLGMVISSGNTSSRSASGFVEFVARSKRQRLSLGAYGNYGDDGHDVIVRNSKASIKYDLFVTKRLYPYAAAFFEGDEFQDLTLRTALSAGFGYQIIDKGDFEGAAWKDLQLSVEGGLAYFDEDFDVAPDDSYISGRWALRLDWPLIADRLALFHHHEGYPSLENQHDLYIISEQGVRLTIVKNFNATIQVNYRWDNTPSPGFRRLDTLYLLTLGYAFDF